MNAVARRISTHIIERARRGDLEAVRWLLDVEFLPSADIDESALEHFLVCRDEIGLAGVVGLELYRDAALLRSLVVTEKHFGCGLGRRLVASAEELAAAMNTRSIYLLTTTAESFFAYLGYKRIARDEVPTAIRTTREFASLCPATAVVMVKP